MKPVTAQRLLWIVLPLAVGLVTPSLVLFRVMVHTGGRAPGRALADILGRQFAPGHNLFLIAVVGLVPFVALALVCVLLAGRLPARRLACLGFGGLLGILLLIVPAHAAVWTPLYGPGRGGSTDAIIFVTLPFFCLATMALGLGAGWLVSRLPLFQIKE